MSIIDTIIILLVAAMGVFGFFKGFIKSVISLFGFLLSLIIAIFAAKAVANALLSVDFFGKIAAGESGSLFSWLYKKLPSGLENITTAELAGAEDVKALFKSQAPWFLRMIYPLVSSGLTNSLYLSALDNARQIMALELAFGIFTLMTGIILFVLIRIVAAALSIAFKGLAAGKITLVGRTLGAAVGAVKGVIYCMIVLCVFSLISNFSFMKTINEKINESALAAGMTDIAVKIPEKILKGKASDSRYERLLSLAGFDYEELAE